MKVTCSVFFVCLADNGVRSRHELVYGKDNGVEKPRFLIAGGKTYASKFKMFWKVAETTCNINNVFGSGTTTEHTVQWWFKKFAKEKRALKMRSTVPATGS